ncbi:MAG: SEL1-like repeat protein [Magnetococcales bacterium]|nr:SEL1-like repeat protein [Magnetococcales bacterium]
MTFFSKTLSALSLAACFGLAGYSSAQTTQQPERLGSEDDQGVVAQPATFENYLFPLFPEQGGNPVQVEISPLDPPQQMPLTQQKPQENWGDPLLVSPPAILPRPKVPPFEMALPVAHPLQRKLATLQAPPVTLPLKKSVLALVDSPSLLPRPRQRPPQVEPPLTVPRPKILLLAFPLPQAIPLRQAEPVVMALPQATPFQKKAPLLVAMPQVSPRQRQKGDPNSSNALEETVTVGRWAIEVTSPQEEIFSEEEALSQQENSPLEPPIPSPRQRVIPVWVALPLTAPLPREPVPSINGPQTPPRLKDEPQQEASQAQPSWIAPAQQPILDEGGVDEQNEKNPLIVAYGRLAERGDSRAQVVLGNLYLNGGEESYQPTKAFYWFKQAAHQGDKRAQFTLGTLYQHGKGTPQNDQEALKWFLKVVEPGSESTDNPLSAQILAWTNLKLGIIYYEGNGVPPNYPLAMDYLKRVSANNHAYGQYLMGLMYAEGKGVAPNRQEAVYWLELAAEQGFKPAQVMLDQGVELQR